MFYLSSHDSVYFDKSFSGAPLPDDYFTRRQLNQFLDKLLNGLTEPTIASEALEPGEETSHTFQPMHKVVGSNFRQLYVIFTLIFPF